MILVLGSRGFVGSAICSYLKEISEPFVGIDVHNYSEYVGAECSFFINANGNSSKRLADMDPVDDFERNVKTTLRALTDFSFESYLHISSIDVYNDTAHPARNTEDAVIDHTTLSPYGFDKWLAERVVERHAAQYVIFRLGGMFGPNMRKGPAFDVLNEQPLWVSPESEYLFLDTALVAEYMWRLRQQSGCIFNLVATAPLSLRRFAEISGKAVREVKNDVKMCYHVNNAKARRFTPIPSSEECVRRVLSRGVE